MGPQTSKYTKSNTLDFIVDVLEKDTRPYVVYQTSNNHKGQEMYFWSNEFDLSLPITVSLSHSYVPVSSLVLIGKDDSVSAATAWWFGDVPPVRFQRRQGS